MFCSTPLLLPVMQSAERNVTGETERVLCEPPHTSTCTQHTKSYRESVQGVGTPEEGEGKSSESLRRVGNKKVGRECESELVKAEMGRERRKGTGIF